jgi:hypothetical protein
MTDDASLPETPVIDQRNPAAPQRPAVVFNPTPVIAPKEDVRLPLSPTEVFQRSLSTALDQSFDSFKPTVNREVSAAFRSISAGLEASVYTAFIEGLVGEVSEFFSTPEPLVVSDDPLVIQKLTLTFDEGARPIRRLFQESETKAAQVREKKFTELGQLSLSVNELKTSVKGIADSAIQEFERERFEAANRRDQEQAKARGIERRARSLKLKRADLDSRLQHQKMEKQSVERLLKQIDDARREWEDAANEPSASMAQRVQKDMESLASELSPEATQAFEWALDDCISLMNAVRDGLRSEICELEMAERRASRLRPPQRRVTGAGPGGVGEQPILQQAREKIQAHRLQRELGMKEVAENMRLLNDNQRQ